MPIPRTPKERVRATVRATVHRCDEEDGTHTWDVCQGFDRGIRRCVAQGFSSRAEARAYARKLNGGA